MSLEKKVFEKALQMRLPINLFGNCECMFYKGFKFEKEKVDCGNDIYRVYDIRPLYYKYLSKDQLDIILRFGILMASDLMSYNLYQNLISRYAKILSSGRNGYKMIERFNKGIDIHKKRCENIVSIHHKNKELFVELVHNH